MAAFEDAGFCCVDNMPVTLLPAFLKLQGQKKVAGFAFVMDLREEGFLDRYPLVFERLKKKGITYEILFLEAEETVLVQRYSQTRRPHPLARDGGLVEGIIAEQAAMAPLRKAADRVIDTSGYTVHELKSAIFTIAREKEKNIPIRITVLSFGFKYGIPKDADLVMDVRFLENPYFVPQLKPLDGRTPEIREFVLNRDGTRTFLEKYLGLLDYLLPMYESEGKAYLTIAVGCTGGRHRSVAIAGAIHEHIRNAGRWANLSHRDIEKG